jgi:hypothetical protein
MSENSTEMPEETRKNFFRSLQANAIKAKNRVVSATKHLGTKIKDGFKALLRGSKKAAVKVAHVAASAIRYVGVGILTVAQYIVLVVNAILMGISLAVMIVLNAVYKFVLAICLALMTPNDLATGGKDLAKDNWAMYWAGWKPRNYFTLTLGEVARAEGLRATQIFMDSEADEDDVPPAQQPKGRATPRRRPHPRRVRPTVVPA